MSLELARQGRVELSQKAPFAPLYLRAPDAKPQAGFILPRKA